MKLRQGCGAFERYNMKDHSDKVKDLYTDFSLKFRVTARRIIILTAVFLCLGLLAGCDKDKDKEEEPQ